MHKMYLRMVIGMDAEIWSKIYQEDKKHIRETGWSYFEGPRKETDNESDSEDSQRQKPSS